MACAPVVVGSVLCTAEGDAAALVADISTVVAEPALPEELLAVRQSSAA